MLQLPARGPVARKPVDQGLPARRTRSPCAACRLLWDYIGWKDPIARKDFSARQRKLTLLQKNALVYTPQVMLQGRDFRSWSTPAFDAALARINAQPAQARIALRIHGASGDAVEVEARAETRGQPDEAALYVAAYASRVESAVRAGENRGRILLHDFVALEWRGPIALEGGAVRTRMRLALLPRARLADSGIAAFVQNRRTGEVLQALMRPYCGG